MRCEKQHRAGAQNDLFSLRRTAAKIAGMKRAIAILFVVALSGCEAGNRDAGELWLYAASSTIEPVESIVEKFEAETGIKVNLQFAGSSRLANQIVQGSRADLFISANQEWIDELAKRDYLSKYDGLVGNQVVVVYHRDAFDGWSPATFNDLVDKRIDKVAIADVDSVPAGIYAKRALQEKGVWNSVSAKLVYSPDVRQVLTQVHEGRVPVGFVYASDARLAKDIVVSFEIEHELTGPVVYSLGLTGQGAELESARELYRWFQGDSAKEVWQQFGFQLLQ